MINRSDVEWVVLKNGKVWSDRFDDEDFCVEHIEDCVNRGIGIVDDFSYREMKLSEIKEYD